MENSIGKLYIVPTPIGNLGDITFRSVEVLLDVDTILCEDTRVSKKLLNKYEIDKPLLSYRDQNHQRAFQQILSELLSGNNLAIVTDAGTPLISDPGFRLVTELIEQDIEIVSLPGPSSVIAALAASGLPTDKFKFVGFLQKKPKKAEDTMRMEMNGDYTLILFESPHRLLKTLRLISHIDPRRYVAVVKDLSKMHERIARGYVEDVIALFNENKSIKGEYVILVAKEGYSLSKDL